MFFNITFQRRCWQVCPSSALRNLHSWLISPGVQLDLPHTEDIFKSTNILEAPSVWLGGRLDSRFELGSLIQGFDTQNMIFFKNVWNKNWSQDIFWGTWIFSNYFYLKFFWRIYFQRSGSQNRLTPYWLGLTFSLLSYSAAS